MRRVYPYNYCLYMYIVEHLDTLLPHVCLSYTHLIQCTCTCNSIVITITICYSHREEYRVAVIVLLLCNRYSYFSLDKILYDYQLITNQLVLVQLA